MFKHILIPTDGSALSLEAVKAGVEFAKQAGARVTVVTVTIPFPHTPLGVFAADTHALYEAGMLKEAEQRLAGAQAIAVAAGVVCDTRADQNWHPYQTIIAAAEDAHCDAIFMASHGRRGVAGLLLGSETHKVLTHSTLPVVVYR